MPNRVSSTCFNNTQQSQAWTCNLIYSGLYLNITKNTDFATPGDYSVSINCNRSLTIAGDYYSYGEQPPLIPNPLAMELVNDTFEPTRGPAWFRMMPYNKTVLVHENALIAPNALGTRDLRSNAFGVGPGDFKRKGLAQVGDRPWICTWPETFLELFIYPQQITGGSKPSSSSSTTPPTSSVTPESGSPAAAGAYPSSSATPTESSTTSSAAGNTTAGGSNPTPTPPYPRVMKLEERRLDDSAPAVCSQVEIKEINKPAVPVLDKDGNPVVITISELEPTTVAAIIADVPSDALEKRSPNGQWHDRQALEGRDTGADISPCGCMWFWT